MSHVLSLISDPAAPALDAGLVDSIRASLSDLADSFGEIVWLAEGEAADIPHSAADPARVCAALREQFTGIDINGVSVENRRRKILIADMDSTLITSETLDDLAKLAGIYDRIAPITARAMRGELDFEGALKERMSMLKGQPLGYMDRLLEEIEITGGAETLVRTMRASGAYCALVSGGFKNVTVEIGKRLGFHEDRSNTLLDDGTVLTGEVAEPILGKEAKLEALHELCKKHDVTPEEAATVGDGANDVDMLQGAGLGVAFHGKPAVREAAPHRLDHGDLTGLLYLQGYRKDEFVS